MKILYPGSFDPLTNGHLDLIKRGVGLFGEILVAVITNPSKSPIFSIDDRLRQIKEATKDIGGVEVQCFEGLTVNFARKNGIKAIVRGLRAMSDFEYELQIAHTNRSLDEKFETIFLATETRYSFLSSSVVKEVARFGGKTSHMVPEEVAKDLSRLFNEVSPL